MCSKGGGGRDLEYGSWAKWNWNAVQYMGLVARMVGVWCAVVVRLEEQWHAVQGLGTENVELGYDSNCGGGERGRK